MPSFTFRDGLVTIPHAPRSPEWVQERTTHIGASEVASLIPGICPPSWEATPLRLFRQKKGLIDATPSSWPMKCGNAMEAAIANDWSEETGHPVIEVPSVYDHDLPWRMISIDRIAFINGEPVIVEVKWSSEHYEEVPAHYLCQITYQMAVSGIHRAIMLAAGPKVAPYELPVEWRPELAATLLTAVDDFWHNHIETNEAPDPTTTKERMEVAKMVLAEANTTVSATDELADLIRASLDAAKRVKEATDAKKEADAYLSEEMAKQGASKVTSAWGNASLIRKRGQIRYAAAVKRLGITESDLEQDRGPDTSYITVTPAKGVAA